jgi:hypothetical protein
VLSRGRSSPGRGTLRNRSAPCASRPREPVKVRARAGVVG